MPRSKSKSKPVEDPEVAPDTDALPVDEETAKMIDELRAELTEAINARQRALADFANYQRRADENCIRARRDGAAAIVRALLNVVDNVDLALGQNAEDLSVEQILDGVRIVREELDKAFEMHGVRRVEPAVGDPFNPMEHEAMLRQPAEGVPADHITSVFQSGFAMGETILRPAKVTVAPPDDEASEG